MLFGIVFIFALCMLCLSFGQTSNAASFTVLWSKGYLDPLTGAYYVFGEVQNIGDTAIWANNITINYYDNSNNFLKSSTTVPSWLPILPNEKTLFCTILYDDANESKILGPKIDHYSIEVTGDPVYDVVPIQLNIKSQTNETTEYSYTAKGEIENVGNTNSNFTLVYASFYDMNGNPIYIWFDITDPENLAPGETTTFEITAPIDLVPQIASYSLTPGGFRDCSFGLPPSVDPPVTGTGNGTFPPFSDTVWAPATPNAVVSPVVAVAAVGTVAAVAAVGASNPTSWAGKVCDKCKDMVPEGAKKWFEEFIASKSKRTTDRKAGSTFAPTRGEIVAYTVSLIALTIGFSYAEVSSLNEILFVLPTILATAVLIEVVKTYTLEVVARRNGVWAEHKIWFFGLVMFIVTSFGFGLPFSSPSKNEYYCEHTTKRLTAAIASTSIFIALAFAAVFFGLLSAGFYLIGSTGLGMCIILGFVDSLPIAPMSGKALFKYKKATWAGVFLLTLAIYVCWILFL
jgi:hypothetical protein